MTEKGEEARNLPKLMEVGQEFSIDEDVTHLSIENFDRTKIAGSFVVHLLKDGRPIASRFFFQPAEIAQIVAEGREPRFAHFDFRLPAFALAQSRFIVEIQPQETVGLAGDGRGEAGAGSTLNIVFTTAPGGD